MAASPNRDRLFIQPLGTSRRLSSLSLSTLAPLPVGAERIAEIDNTGHFASSDDYGWLVRLANGKLVIIQATGSMRNVDPRKAVAALRRMDTYLPALAPDDGMDVESGEDIVVDPEPSSTNAKRELAAFLKEWRADAGISQSRAAQMLGIPVRTLQNIEHSRGFPYPALIYLAIQAFRSTPDRDRS